MCVVIQVGDEDAVWKLEDRELLLREEWDYVRELVVRIQFEIWSKAKIPDLKFISLNSKVNFLLLGWLEEEQMSCFRFGFVVVVFLWKFIAGKIQRVMEVIFGAPARCCDSTLGTEP